MPLTVVVDSGRGVAQRACVVGRTMENKVFGACARDVMNHTGRLEGAPVAEAHRGVRGMSHEPVVDSDNGEFTHTVGVVPPVFPVTIRTGVHIVAVREHLTGGDNPMAEHSIDGMDHAVVKVLPFNVNVGGRVGMSSMPYTVVHRGSTSLHMRGEWAGATGPSAFGSHDIHVVFPLFVSGNTFESEISFANIPSGGRSISWENMGRGA